MKTFKQFIDDASHLAHLNTYAKISETAAKEYCKQWLDEAAEVAMLQAEKGLPVGDAVLRLKDQIDAQ